MLQECMELRKKYVFRARPPWHSDRKWPARDPATHKLIQSPFQYTPEAGTDHVFSMKDGVMTVFANKECEWLDVCPHWVVLVCFLFINPFPSEKFCIKILVESSVLR
jgi:hypothetical protein